MGVTMAMWPHKNQPFALILRMGRIRDHISHLTELSLCFGSAQTAQLASPSVFACK